MWANEKSLNLGENILGDQTWVKTKNQTWVKTKI